VLRRRAYSFFYNVLNLYCWRDRSYYKNWFNVLFNNKLTLLGLFILLNVSKDSKNQREKKKKEEAHEKANCSKSTDTSELGTYVVSLDVIRPEDSEFD